MSDERDRPNPPRERPHVAIIALAAGVVATLALACTTEKTIVVVATPTPATIAGDIPATEVPPPPTEIPPAPTNTPRPPPPPVQQLIPAAQPPPVQPLAPAAPEPPSDCHPSYPTLCLPGSPDLDCGDISARRFPVTGSDPHGFDGDFDGVGCESG